MTSHCYFNADVVSAVVTVDNSSGVDEDANATSTDDPAAEARAAEPATDAAATDAAVHLASFHQAGVSSVRG